MDVVERPRPIVRTIWRSAPLLSLVTGTMIIYSLALTWWAWELGIAIGKKGIPGYFQKLNWFLFPMYWPLLALMIYFTWKLYIDGWQSLQRNKVLCRNGSPVKESDTLEPFVRTLRSIRPFLILVSLPAGLYLTWLDASCLLNEYGVGTPSSTTCPELDFTVAFRLSEIFTHLAGNNFVEHKAALFPFVVATYVMQGILIAMAVMTLGQLLLHNIAFLFFEHWPCTKKHRLSICLNADDGWHEFGLMRMNRAINLTYVFIAIAMLIPIISVANKPVGDTGKVLMAYLLPLLLFAPATITFLDRALRWNEAISAVDATNDPELKKSFLEQKLWPLDQTGLALLGKFCLGLAAASWVYVVAGDLKALLGAV